MSRFPRDDINEIKLNMSFLYLVNNPIDQRFERKVKLSLEFLFSIESNILRKPKFKNFKLTAIFFLNVKPLNDRKTFEKIPKPWKL